MSCRESKLSSAMITFARHHSGLTDEQILYMNHNLMRVELPDGVDPSVTQWNDFIDDVLYQVRSGQLVVPPRSRGLLDRLESARTETPNRLRLFASAGLVREALESSRAHALYLEHYARDAGLTTQEAKDRFDTYYQTGLASSLGPTSGFAARWGGIPARDNPIGNAQYRLLHDHPSLYAYEQMEAIRRIAVDEDTPYVSNRHAIFSSFISEMGYNSDTESIEVVMRSDRDRIYSYEASYEEYEEFNAARVPGSWFSANLRGRAFTTRSISEEGPRLPYRCDACGQFSNMQHTCPAVLRARDVLNDLNNILVNDPSIIVQAVPVVIPTFLFRQPINGFMGSDGRVNLTLSGRDDLTAMARSQGVRVPIRILASMADNNSSESCVVSGEVNIAAVGENTFINPVLDDRSFAVAPVATDNNPNNLICSCADFIANGTCIHSTTAIRSVEQILNYNPDGSSRRSRSYSPRASYDYEAMSRADSLLAEEYEASLAATDRATREWVGLSTSMVENPDLFNELFEEYNRLDKAYIESLEATNTRRHPSLEDSNYRPTYDYSVQHPVPVPYLRENAFGGLANRENGRGFGTELEFSFPPGFTETERREAIRAIGEKLFEAGLTGRTEQRGYGATHGHYVETHNRGWSFESDGTTGSSPGGNRGEVVFGGEIVSPVMYDEPETWENLEKVCRILREAKAIPSNRAGGHVHVGVGDYDHRVENHNRLISSVFNNEDLLYRLSAEPSSKRHRGLSYCSPNRSAPGAYRSIADSVGSNTGHGIALNLQGVQSRASRVDARAKDHVEFRTFDSSLEPSVIQAQIGLAVYMAEAGLRAEGSTVDMEKKEIGSNGRKLNLAKPTLTKDDWNESTLDMRKFLDRFVPGSRDGDEKNNPRVRQMIALYATTRWQTSGSAVIDDNTIWDTLQA